MVVEIAKHKIGPGHSCFIIAEAGVNHNGDLALALRLVDAAKEAGADAVKFQTFRAEKLVSSCAPKARYQLQTTDARESQFEMIRRLELPREHHRRIQAYCEKRRILFLSSPFDAESADFLDALGLPAFKIPSGEITHLEFLAHVARKGKPMIVSTGMSTLEEVQGAVQAIEAAGNPPLVLLHCVSSYPADPSDVNLRAMGTLRSTFGRVIGFSDHTLGIEVAVAAVALGAKIVEKHLTLDRAMPGPDHVASLDPQGFSDLVKGIRQVEKALGDGQKRPAPSEQDTAAVARKSLIAARDIPAGMILSKECVAVQRPGTGLPPSIIYKLLGRRANRDISAGSLLSMEMFSCVA